MHFLNPVVARQQILAHNPLKPHHIKHTLYGDVYLMPSILDTNTETDD